MTDKEMEDFLARAKALMDRRQRFSLWWSGARLTLQSYARRYVPGYRFLDLMIWRMKRQGISGAWEPPFDISKQDFDKFDKRIRWHGWGVVEQWGEYRAYTPTSYSDRFETPRRAWEAAQRVYWGKPPLDGDNWTKKKK